MLIKECSGPLRRPKSSSEHRVTTTERNSTAVRDGRESSSEHGQLLKREQKVGIHPGRLETAQNTGAVPLPKNIKKIISMNIQEVEPSQGYSTNQRLIKHKHIKVYTRITTSIQEVEPSQEYSVIQILKWLVHKNNSQNHHYHMLRSIFMFNRSSSEDRR